MPLADAGVSEVAEALREVEEKRGSFSNFHRILANSPQALRAYESLSHHVRNESPLDAKLRELVILRTVQIVRNNLEWRYHLLAALKLGYTQDELESVGRWQESNLFGPRERAALALVDEQVRDSHVTAECMGHLAGVFSPAEIVELCMLIGLYLLASALQMPFGLGDDDRSAVPVVPMIQDPVGP